MARSKGLSRTLNTVVFRKVFYLALLACTLFSVVLAFFGKSVFRFSVTEKLFSDFWETVRFALSPDPYGAELHSSYPPVAFLVVYPFSLICKSVVFTLPMAECVTSAPFLLAYAAYVLFFTAAVSVLLCKLVFGKITWLRTLECAFVTLTCLPTAFLIVRGNVLFVSLTCILMFFLWKDSQNKWLRFLSYASLAVAGTVKLYAILFVLLLARQGRMLDCLKVLALFLAIFFLPFGFYGFETISVWWNRLFGFVIYRMQSVKLHNIGILQPLVMLKIAVEYLGGSMGTGYSAALCAVQVVFLVLAAFCVLFTKNEGRAFLLCTMLCCTVANPSYLYTGMYLLVCLLTDLHKERIGLGKALFYAVFFLPVIYIKWAGAYAQMAVCVLLSVTLIVQSALEIRREYGLKSLANHAFSLLKGFRYNCLYQEPEAASGERLPAKGEKEKVGAEILSDTPCAAAAVEQSPPQ